MMCRMAPPIREDLTMALPGDRWTLAVAGVLDAIRGDVGRRAEEGASGRDDLAVAATFHGVEGLVRQSVGPGTPSLDRAVHAATGRHQRALADLERVEAALGGARLPFLVVKGPALASTVYAAPELRSYVDLDLLVCPVDLPRVVPVLEAVGFVLVDANWPMLTAAGVHELRLEGPSGGALDLHWALTGSAGGMHSPPADALMARSVEIDIDGMPVRTLAPADTVVHVAVHAAGSGGHRLVWLTDLQGALGRAVDLGPSGLLRTVDDWRARPALDLMLRRGARLLGTDPPGGLDRLVEKGPWRALVATADRVSPPQLVGTRASISRLVARACRDTPAASLRAAAGKARGWAGGDRQGPVSPRELLDPDNPSSALHAVGGRAAAEAFLQRVASGQPSGPAGGSVGGSASSSASNDPPSAGSS